jgi:hypothetical protein
MLFDNRLYRVNNISDWKEWYPSESATVKLVKPYKAQSSDTYLFHTSIVWYNLKKGNKLRTFIYSSLILKTISKLLVY